MKKFKFAALAAAMLLCSVSLFAACGESNGKDKDKDETPEADWEMFSKDFQNANSVTYRTAHYPDFDKSEADVNKRWEKTVHTVYIDFVNRCLCEEFYTEVYNSTTQKTDISQSSSYLILKDGVYYSVSEGSNSDRYSVVEEDQAKWESECDDYIDSLSSLDSVRMLEKMYRYDEENDRWVFTLNGDIMFVVFSENGVSSTTTAEEGYWIEMGYRDYNTTTVNVPQAVYDAIENS